MNLNDSVFATVSAVELTGLKVAVATILLPYEFILFLSVKKWLRKQPSYKCNAFSVSKGISKKSHTLLKAVSVLKFFDCTGLQHSLSGAR